MVHSMVAGAFLALFLKIGGWKKRQGVRQEECN